MLFFFYYNVVNSANSYGLGYFTRSALCPEEAQAKYFLPAAMHLTSALACRQTAPQQWTHSSQLTLCSHSRCYQQAFFHTTCSKFCSVPELIWKAPSLLVSSFLLQLYVCYAAWQRTGSPCRHRAELCLPSGRVTPSPRPAGGSPGSHLTWGGHIHSQRFWDVPQSGYEEKRWSGHLQIAPKPSQPFSCSPVNRKVTAKFVF